MRDYKVSLGMPIKLTGLRITGSLGRLDIYKNIVDSIERCSRFVADVHSFMLGSPPQRAKSRLCRCD